SVTGQVGHLANKVMLRRARLGSDMAHGHLNDLGVCLKVGRCPLGNLDIVTGEEHDAVDSETLKVDRARTHSLTLCVQDRDFRDLCAQYDALWERRVIGCRK